MGKLEHRHDRGYLPHFDAGGFTQFITFRLAGSLPRTFIAELDHKKQARLISEVEYFRQVEKFLDQPAGPTYLRNTDLADLVADTIKRFDGLKYELHAWVIMPNHVHLLLSPNQPVSEIIHSIKSFTSKAANKLLRRRGSFWSPDYFDRFIRNKTHYLRCIRYIEDNPVKAGMCASADLWRWSSAFGVATDASGAEALRASCPRSDA